MLRQINVYMDKHAYLSWIHVCSPKALAIRKWIPHSLLWQYRSHVCNGNSRGKRCSPITKISRVWWSWWDDWWAIASTLKIDLRVSKDSSYSWQWILCTKGNHWIKEEGIVCISTDKETPLLAKIHPKWRNQGTLRKPWVWLCRCLARKTRQHPLPYRLHEGTRLHDVSNVLYIWELEPIGKVSTIVFCLIYQLAF